MKNKFSTSNLDFKSFSLIFVSLLASVFSTYAQQTTNQQAVSVEIKQEVKSNINTVEKTEANAIPESNQTKNNPNIKTSIIGGKTIADNGLFTYEITGNEQMDNDLYSVAKTEFIKKNPELYEKWASGEISITPQATDIKKGE